MGAEWRASGERGSTVVIGSTLLRGARGLCDQGHGVRGGVRVPGCPGSALLWGSAGPGHARTPGPAGSAGLGTCADPSAPETEGSGRSLYEFAPRSIVARLSDGLVAGFDTYGFDDKGGFADLSRINDKDLSGKEFWIGGDIVRSMPKEENDRLAKAGVHLFENPQKLLGELSATALAG